VPVDPAAAAKGAAAAVPAPAPADPSGPPLAGNATH